MRIKRIKQGKNIEIFEEINIIDGTEIIIEIQEIQPTSEEEKHKSLNEVFGAWKHDTEIIDIFAEIDRERHEERASPEELVMDIASLNKNTILALPEDK